MDYVDIITLVSDSVDIVINVGDDYCFAVFAAVLLEYLNDVL